MSFRDNLQHLRATRNITQEQLAMLLGVSRQSVSKWEAERAYPEMDKLLKICDLFDCTLDELVLGDSTARPPGTAYRMPSRKAAQDVTGYDQAMRTYAWKLALGVFIIVMGAALAFLLSGFVFVPGVDPWSYVSVLLFIGAGIGLALIIPARFERNGFRKAHPFIEDFYTVDQKNQARTTMSTGIVVGIGFVMAGFAAIMLLQAADWLSSSVFLMLLAAAAFFIIRGCLVGSRCNLEKYNRKSLRRMDEAQVEALGDGELQERARRVKREDGVYPIVMSVATAVALVLLFVPALNARDWFWLAWPVGALLCGAIKAFRSLRSDT